MSEELYSFIKARKTSNLIDLIKSTQYSAVPEESFKQYCLKIQVLVDKFDSYLKREEEKYLKRFTHEDNLSKTVRHLKNKFKSRTKREQISKLLLDSDEIPSFQRSSSAVQPDLLKDLQNEFEHCLQSSSM
jgi:hypothetical protein